MLFTKQHDIRPRSLRETVKLLRKVSATDEYGMQSLKFPHTSGSGSGSGSGCDAVVGVFPASVEMMSGYAKTNYYQTAEIEAYDVRLRYIPDKFEEIRWNGMTLSVDSVEDEGMRGRWLRVRCSRRGIV